MKNIFEHWGKTFIFAATAMPIGALGLHYVEVFLHWCGLPSDVLSVFHFFYVEVIILDGILMSGSALIGVWKLLDQQWEEWWRK